MKSRTLRPGVFIPLLVMASLTGCFSKPSVWEVTHPAKGSVTYKGKPLENAELTLFPLDQSAPESVRPKAKSTSDGKFSLGTYAVGDGAPAGKYKVTVVRNEVSVSKDTIVAKPNDLPSKYSAAASTDLEVEIVVGENELPPLNLK